MQKKLNWQHCARQYYCQLAHTRRLHAVGHQSMVLPKTQVACRVVTPSPPMPLTRSLPLLSAHFLVRPHIWAALLDGIRPMQTQRERESKQLQKKGILSTSIIRHVVRIYIGQNGAARWAVGQLFNCSVLHFFSTSAQLSSALQFFSSCPVVAVLLLLLLSLSLSDSQYANRAATIRVSVCLSVRESL